MYTLIISEIAQSQPRDVVLRKTGFRSVEAARNYYHKTRHAGVCSYQVIDASGYVVDSN